MEKTRAVRIIFERLMYGGLPEAIKIYNYLSCNGEITVDADMIDRYFKERR